MESISPVRISTSLLYDQQTNSINNLLYQQSTLGDELSTGKKVNKPSDDPAHIGTDLLLRTNNAVLGTSDTSFEQANDQLTTVDSTMSSITSSLQSARQLTVEAANDAVDPASRASIGQQVDQLLQQMVTLANTNYAGKYIFAGSSSPTTPPVQQVGTPITSVNFTGNAQHQGQLGADGSAVNLSTTLQEAFNFNAPDGSLNVFQVLINLRNSMTGAGPITLGASGQQVPPGIIDQSAASVNSLGQVIDPNANLSTSANSFGVALTTGPGNILAFQVDGPGGVANISVNTTTTPLDGTGGLVGIINAQTATTGVTATWDTATQKLTLSAIQPFKLTDVQGNFSAAFQLSTQADTVDNLSRQLGDIDHVLAVNLTSRALVGTTQQTVSALNNRYNTTITNNTATQSQIEDADFASTYSQFAQAQTALQSAYATTTRLEAKTLFDYL